MRGPSSSHSAAALRIGRIARDLMNGELVDVLVEYDPSGSLVTTHLSQGSDMGLYGGLLGWNADDERLLEYERHMAEAGIRVVTEYASYGATHPNTYKLTLRNAHDERHLTALSLGGGMIQVIKIDDQEVNLSGGSFALYDADQRQLLSQSPRQPQKPAGDIRVLRPVIPVLDGGAELPFANAAEMLAFASANSVSLAESATAYESARSGMSAQQVRGQVRRVLAVMQSAADNGLQGTEYDDRILPSQVGRFQSERRRGRMVGGDSLQDVIETVTAVLETKSSMGPIVAAPTAGSCGVVPGTLLGVARHLELSEELLVDGLLVAGVIGMFIARGATFSAEEGGCMAECGSASAMVSAALVTVRGGSSHDCIAAASMALQNSFGMICDPIGNRVEAPCLGKNTLAATNAMSCANMALAGYEHLVPFDQVVAAMDEVGKALPRELCCTGLGGLATTPAAQAIEARMKPSCSRCVTFA
jgi:L-serine dehydratase